MDKLHFNYQVNPQFWTTYLATMTAFIVNPRVGETLHLPQRIFKMSWLAFCMYTKRPVYMVSSSGMKAWESYDGWVPRYGDILSPAGYQRYDPLSFVGYQTHDLSGAMPIDPYTTFFGG